MLMVRIFSRFVGADYSSGVVRTEVLIRPDRLR